jgi:hypothetical protein
MRRARTFFALATNEPATVSSLQERLRMNDGPFFHSIWLAMLRSARGGHDHYRALLATATLSLEAVGVAGTGFTLLRLVCLDLLAVASFGQGT